MRWQSPWESFDFQGISPFCVLGLSEEEVARKYTINDLYLLGGQAFHMPSAAMEVMSVLLSSARPVQFF